MMKCGDEFTKSLQFIIVIVRMCLIRANSQVAALRSLRSEKKDNRLLAIL